MAWSYGIGTYFGTELRIHATFLLLLLWVGVSAYVSEGEVASALNVLFVLALFFCVVLHEFGHALMARRFGFRTRDITLLPIGGVARLEKLPDDPGQEILVALAGPAVNVVIWAVLVFVLGSEAHLKGLEEFDLSGMGFLSQLATVNLILVLFNLIPAFPMDGGRVFRAALTFWLGRPRATAVAAGAGQIIAMLFALFGLMSGNLILLLVAFFIFAAATAENADTQLRSVAKDIEARDAMITVYEALHPGDGLDAMSFALLRTTQHDFPVLDETGACRGFVSRDAIFHAAQSKTPMRADQAMTAAVPKVQMRASLTSVLDALADGEARVVAVTDPNGVFVGYVDRENIGELMVLHHKK